MFTRKYLRNKNVSLDNILNPALKVQYSIWICRKYPLFIYLQCPDAVGLNVGGRCYWI